MPICTFAYCLSSGLLLKDKMIRIKGAVAQEFGGMEWAIFTVDT